MALIEPDVLMDPAAMQAWSRLHQRAGTRIALVPTMGALHDGHLELMRVAHSRADAVVVSIFVNPLQFERPDDLAAYPSTFDADLAACRRLRIAAVYAPTAQVMYPPGFETYVEPGATAEPLEGGRRPGHFRGVATVVCKLINAVQADTAVFGEKDFQQLAVIRRMAVDLDLAVQIVGVPTVREVDGLARSSRNVRLDELQRASAPVVITALHAARRRFDAGDRSADGVLAAAQAVLDAEPAARCEYVAVNDAVTLEPVDSIVAPVVLSTAVWFGDVRLIDNVVLVP